MKIIFLVINYRPHQLVSINAIIENYDAEVHSFSFKDDKTLPVGVKNLFTYKYNNFSRIEFLAKLIEINPKLLVVAGWMVKDFVWAGKEIRRKLQIPVVSYSDTQWRGTFKQRINSLLSPWYIKKAFSHIWVAGIYQYEYARKLGFSNNHIIFNSLSCDMRLFCQVSLKEKQFSYPKNFLFVGRFVEVKGLDYLVNAWEKIRDKKDWTLTFVGDGPLKEKYCNRKDIIVKEYMRQELLIEEVRNSGCFILPSTVEPWAVVIHEFACAGLPIIATNVCGATPYFVINGYNGASVKAGSVKAIQEAMEMIINCSDKELYDMSIKSRLLGGKITQEISAASLMSVLN